MLVRGIFTNISGSTGGVTGSRNKGGQYLRARVNPVNPNSPAQQQSRATFADANAAWSGLTPEERTAWNDFAEIQVATNRIGDVIQLSGQQSYVGSYSALESANQTPVNVPPVPNTRPGQLIIPEFRPDISAEDVGAFTAGTEPGTAAYVIAVSAPLPPGVSFFKGPFRTALAVGGGLTATVFSQKIFQAIQVRTPVVTPGMRFAIRIRTVALVGNYSNFAERISGAAIA